MTDTNPVLPADPNKLVVVQFLKKHGPYGAGTVAGFPAQQASKLVTDLKAVLYVEKAIIPERKGIRGIRK